MHKTGAGSAMMSATYSYGGAEAQRTDWEARTNLDGRFISSRHEIDLWSPTCDQPGEPVRLTIDLEVALEGTSTSPAELLLSSHGTFRNAAAAFFDGLQGSDYAEWRLCGESEP